MRLNQTIHSHRNKSIANANERKRVSKPEYKREAKRLRYAHKETKTRGTVNFTVLVFVSLGHTHGLMV